jgi:5-methylcytosine-specific restriction endonuclease McrA
LLFPKKKYKTDRQRRHAEYRKERPEVREEAWELDNCSCVFPGCRRGLLLRDAHIHETIFRSAQGDPTDIDIAVTTCQQCHNDMHVRVGGKLKRIEGSRSEGLRFYQRKHVGDEWREVLQ